MLEAKRTLVKSGPELWAEVSDPGALAGHLAPFGEVRIARTDPETVVEWEAEHGAGRVELAASGFGTRVELTAEIAAPPAPEPPPAEPDRGGRWARLLRRRPEAPEPPPPPAPAPVLSDDEALRVLTETLDTLGRARHRPFSRG